MLRRLIFRPEAAMHTIRNLLPGLSLILALSAAALLLARQLGLAHYGLSPLTLSIVLGALLGNALPQLGQGSRTAGLHFTQKVLLRTGVALYGFNLSVQQIAQVGGTAIGVDLFMACTTLLIGWLVGCRILGLDRETVLLTAAGSAFCGAAAVVATAPVLQADARAIAAKTAPAVATVVLFGTLAMLLYPLLYAWTGAQPTGFGLYIGATVHEVAQVVAIGNMLGDEIASTAVIVKMIRVMLLVPFLLLASAMLRGKGRQAGPVSVPWFAVMFIVFAGINSLQLLPETMVQILRQTGIACLTAAMGALGLDTTFARLRQTGTRVFILGLILFAHLVLTGGVLAYWLGD